MKWIRGWETYKLGATLQFEIYLFVYHMVLVNCCYYFRFVSAEKTLGKARKLTVILVYMILFFSSLLM